MTDFHLPDQTHIGHAHLRVTSLENSLKFYGELMGFKLVRREGSTAVLSATGANPAHLLLTEQPGARPKPARSTGLYHIAIRFPDQASLGRIYARMEAAGWPFQGFSDHIVSEALYLPDPDGNGLEMYRDRPREQWPWENGQVVMGTSYLDVAPLLDAAAQDESPWDGVHPQTDIGHVHLHVSDLGRAEAFYSGVLGFDVVQRTYPGALFISAGKYHHHIGLNVWAGRTPPPADAVGLINFSVQLPDEESWREVLARVQQAGIPVEDKRDYGYAGGVLVRDQDGNGVELLAERALDLAG